MKYLIIFMSMLGLTGCYIDDGMPKPETRAYQICNNHSYTVKGQTRVVQRCHTRYN